MAWWDWIISFCAGDTDFNGNGVPDNLELMRAIEALASRVEELKKP